MRIAVTSDVHLEFGPLILKNEHNIDVLVLSGDICVASDLNYKSDNLGIVSNGKYERMREFFRSCSDNFKHVIYIMGNHEHYHGDFNTSADMLRGFLMNDDDYSNIHFLDKESVARLVACTVKGMANECINCRHRGIDLCAKPSRGADSVASFVAFTVALLVDWITFIKLLS